jgi:hypothetical protein
MIEVGIFPEGSGTEAKSPTSRKNREKWGTQISLGQSIIEADGATRR